MLVFSLRLGRHLVQVVMQEHGRAHLEPQFLMPAFYVMQEHGRR
jgi:hypothetical protein